MDYQKKTVKDLRKIAKNMGISGYSRLVRKDLISLIKKTKKLQEQPSVALHPEEIKIIIKSSRSPAIMKALLKRRGINTRKNKVNDLIKLLTEVELFQTIQEIQSPGFILF